MNKRKRMVSVLAGIMAAVMVLTLLLSILPTRASAASSSEIRKQINAMKEDLKDIKSEIENVQQQYQENQDEIADIIAKKNVIDQELRLLNEQVLNINEQIKAYNILIADKQDELDNAESRLSDLNDATKDRIRAMEEEGQLSYWEVLFKANSFSDLLDRLSMVEEIAASDNRRLRELSDAADAVDEAQAELESEKAELEVTKKELDTAQAQMDDKRAEADALIQELLAKADDLDALEAEFEKQEEDFLKQIAAKELEYNEAKQREWEAYMATYVPPTTAAAGSTGSGSTSNSTATNSGSTGGSAGSGGTWLVPCSYTSITSPFGNRTSPTTGASSYHQGVDLDTGTGWAVVATRAGTAYTGYNSTAGNYVTIDHHDGYRSIYMHLSGFSISNGTNVSAGQQIGLTGSTGVSTGDHLHFGISYNGVYVNPCAYVAL